MPLLIFIFNLNNYRRINKTKLNNYSVVKNDLTEKNIRHQYNKIQFVYVCLYNLVYIKNLQGR